MKRKSLQELTISNNFMFAAVMMENDNCKRLLEIIFQREIKEVAIEKEKSIVYNPEYRGVRLDIYLKDENNSRFNIEMQTLADSAIAKRSRFYHSHISMDLLRTGEEYELLPETYVIFICDFDPFGCGRYIYSFENVCLEDGELKLKDGSHTIFLSTAGKITKGVSTELIKFLEYVKSDLKESSGDFGDKYVSDLQETIRQIKTSHEMENRYMLLELMLRDERREGKAEGKAEDLILVLNEKGNIPESLVSKVNSEKDSSVLESWIKLALSSPDIDSFIKSIS